MEEIDKIMEEIEDKVNKNFDLPSRIEKKEEEE